MLRLSRRNHELQRRIFEEAAELAQQPVADDASPLGEEAGAGQDTAVGEKGDQAAGSQKMHDMAAERGTQFGVCLDAVEHGSVALDIGVVASIRRPQHGNQTADQFQRIGLRVAEAIEGFDQRIG